MTFCDHLWDYSCDTVRECRFCGELQFGTGKQWSFETVVEGNPRLAEPGTYIPDINQNEN